MSVEIARAIRLQREQQEIELTAARAQHDLERLCEKRAFKEVRMVLSDVQRYMDETIDVLEEEDKRQRTFNEERARNRGY